MSNVRDFMVSEDMAEPEELLHLARLKAYKPVTADLTGHKAEDLRQVAETAPRLIRYLQYLQDRAHEQGHVIRYRESFLPVHGKDVRLLCIHTGMSDKFLRKEIILIVKQDSAEGRKPLLFSCRHDLAGRNVETVNPQDIRFSMEEAVSALYGKAVSSGYIAPYVPEPQHPHRPAFYCSKAAGVDLMFNGPER